MQIIIFFYVNKDYLVYVCVKILVSNTFIDFIFIACCKTAFEGYIAKDLELLERRK